MPQLRPPWRLLGELMMLLLDNPLAGLLQLGIPCLGHRRSFSRYKTEDIFFGLVEAVAAHPLNGVGKVSAAAVAAGAVEPPFLAAPAPGRMLILMVREGASDMVPAPRPLDSHGGEDIEFLACDCSAPILIP
jgi:hypothetical protein